MQARSLHSRVATDEVARRVIAANQILRRLREDSPSTAFSQGTRDLLAALPDDLREMAGTLGEAGAAV